MKKIALVYMVAGLSSRFGGKIKQFAKVGPNNETLIKYSIKQALVAGFSKIIFIVGNKTEKPFKEMFGEKYKNIPILYAKQNFDQETREKPWGTADALCSAKELLNCPFVVCNGDDIYGRNSFRTLFEHLQKKETCATLGYKLGEVLPEQGNVNRGIFEINSENNQVKSIRELLGISKSKLNEKNLSPENLCSMNIFALNTETLKSLCKIVNTFKEENKTNPKIECLLPRELGNLIKKEKIIMKIYSTDDKWIGITNPEDEIIVKEFLRNG